VGSTIAMIFWIILADVLAVVFFIYRYKMELGLTPTSWPVKPKAKPKRAGAQSTTAAAGSNPGANATPGVSRPKG